MRRFAVLVIFLLAMPITLAEARSVHSTQTIDMFPQGDMENESEWDFKRHLAFTAEDRMEDGQYVHGMVADNRMTMGINLPEHLDQQRIWASTTSTNSNASIGSPDGAYSWSTGPDITVGGFDVSGLSENNIENVELVVHFDIPNPLQQDKARFSVVNNGIHDLVKTWSNTQSPLYYMTNGWSTPITSPNNWTWQDLANLEINLDYVSNGGTDDSELQVDAVALEITMRTPWYGAERVTSTSINQFTEWPIIDLDITTGQLTSVSTAPCGLNSDSGTWTTEVLEKPAGQSWGRIHTEHNDENGSVTIEYVDNQGAWVSIGEGLIPSVSSDLQLRFTITDTCLTKAWVDINDPHLRVQGSIVGDVSAMVPSATRWTIVVNGETVSNNNGTNLGVFDLQLPIGHVMDSSDSELEITVKSWYNWGNDGAPASVNLVINNLEVIGAYSIEYDEDPTCAVIGSQDLVEDGGGIILPLLSRCSDDRTDTEDLTVQFQNSNTDVVEVDLTEGQIRIKLVPEASGTAQITTTVTDSAGNYWREVSTINVANVDDKPVLAEFPAVVPVEHGYVHTVEFTLTDSDTFAEDLTVTTNRSWATVDMSTREIVIDAPTPGFTSVLITACDENDCVERILDLEVRALAELFVEEIRIDDDIRAGDLFEVKAFVRNSGQVTATMVGVRCSADGQSFGSGVIQVLAPGQLGSVTCDMQAPEDDSSVIIDVEVDRGTSVDEVDETNNLESKVISIGEAVEDTTSADEDDSFEIGQGTIYIAAAGALLLLLAVFGLLAPAKIKKIE
ncbi:MAG: CARDB domain-containing protein [Candidatus Poseidoniaceae archaeon]|tara:strand:- start:3242 stop:5605 length:2364 start_codon:yes stop_codon:yes gene_type:complete